MEMLLLTGEFGIEPITIHVVAVKKTSIYQMFGPEIFIHNLIHNSMKGGG